MFLGPHHFQAQNRYFEECIEFSAANLWFQPYGFAGFELETEALRNGTLALTHARGLFPDGLSFHLPEFDEPPPARHIADLFSPVEENVDVLLGVPARQPDRANCALQQTGDSSSLRYLAEEHPLPDENTGRDVKMIQLGRKNIRFLLSTEDSRGMVTLPIARVRRQGNGTNRF
jgi:type VI secretion system protein ImpJ